jgi:hypothetical protein
MLRARFLFLAALVGFSLFTAGETRADVYGRIRGVVTDPSGAVIPKAKVTALNTGTGISTSTVSGADGSYEFLQLAAPGIYNVSAEADGFKKVEVDDVELHLNEIFVENLKMDLGSVTERVTVTELSTVQVETTSIELGTVINGTEIVNAPLEGRSFVDLMKLQPGVVEASDGRGGQGYGNYSTNGSESDQDSYLINGIDNNELSLNTVNINVSPDAIAEFKMVTNTINPEYGRNSGAIINAIIKSGTNAFHGSGFEFYRDTFLNAKPFFLPSAQVFHQNLFGGTIGGPIWKDHTFFFFSYQGDRFRRNEQTSDCGCSTPGTVQVLNGSELNGNFSDLEASKKVSPFPLVGDNGTTYPAGTAYSTIFSNGLIPAADVNSVSKTLLGFLPSAGANGLFEFSPVVRGIDDQYLARIDHTFSSRDSIWGYFLWERFPTVDDLPFFGATLPGFGMTNKQHWQQYADAWDHTFSATTLNEVTVGYTRFNFGDVFPQNPVAPSSAGFTGINPQLTTGEGLPVVVVNGPSVSAVNFQLGFSEDGPQPRIDQTYQAGDSLSKIVGNHTLKFGFTMRRFEVYNPFAHFNDGAFTFAGTGAFSTGDVGADFLLGIPDSYNQGSGDIANARSQEYYSYVQDQWKIRPNLTLTIGTGWSIDTPMVDNAHDNHAGIAFRPGQQSTVFPTAPEDYVFQGDAGVNAFGTTKFRHFGPRFGLVYSPNWGWLTGGPGKTSIRAGYGIYYNRFNEETATQTQGSPPFAQSSTGVGDIGGTPNFAAPFTGYALSGTNTVTNVSEPNKFPYVPSPNVNFSVLEPMSISVYDPNITIPDAQNFNLTIERQLGNSTVVSVGYVGSLGRHLPLAIELNPLIIPPGCTPSCISSIAASVPFQPTAFPGDYKYPGNIFGSVGDVTTNGVSNYNALQATVNRNLSHGLQFLVSYTYSHALDIASGFENSGFSGGGFGGFANTRSVNPFDPRLNYGDSNYDARQRLVISYTYYFPSVRHFHAFQWIPSRITDGWNVTGTTTFQSGFPLDVVDSSFPSLGPSIFTFYNTFGQSGAWDVPNRVGPVQYMNPRNFTTANYWFNPVGAFSAPAIGTEGNAGRDIIRGPGRNNFDVAFFKDTRITERAKLELRFEFYNLFNHTQFDPNGINTNFSSSGFGTETAAFNPRTIQMAAKVYF